MADTVVDAVKQGAISRFFLVGGCDGARPGRSYFRDFVQQAPDDSIILTLACGKFRFNDLDLGTIGGLPRIMDMGQCNDAYGAIRVAVALAEVLADLARSHQVIVVTHLAQVAVHGDVHYAVTKIAGDDGMPQTCLRQLSADERPADDRPYRSPAMPRRHRLPMRARCSAP